MQTSDQRDLYGCMLRNSLTSAEFNINPHLTGYFIVNIWVYIIDSTLRDSVESNIYCYPDVNRH